MSKLEKVKVEVTQKHINAGMRCNQHYCPIARSLKELGFNGVRVRGNIHVNMGKDQKIFQIFQMSRSASRFMSHFDRDGRKAVKPFRFFMTRKAES